MAKKLKRPKSSFADWLEEVPGNHYLEDINYLFGIGYCVSEKASKLSRQEQLRYSKLICEKIEIRYDDYKHGKWKWDARRWRWYNKLIKKMKALK